MKEKRQRPDRHQSGFLVRLPEEFRDLLARVKKKNRRPYTEEICIALEKHLAEMGLWPPGGNGAPK